jgi:hypothetical protein
VSGSTHRDRVPEINQFIAGAALVPEPQSPKERRRLSHRQRRPTERGARIGSIGAKALDKAQGRECA